jgi:ribonucleoside-diphosphate reductase alpha chain
MDLTENALTVLKRRYLMKDDRGRTVETPTDLFRRVANFIAEADRAYGADDDSVRAVADQFYEAMSERRFMPNSPTLMNAGRRLGQLSACFVLPVGDSMEEIFEANKNAALIHKSGGGTGFSFSRLRPRNSVVASTSGVASGPVSFMKVFNSSTEAVKQGGTRRGANMGILRVDHPDIMEFISCKTDTSEVTNFNISVAVTDVFMAALQNGSEYDLIDPRSGEVFESDGVPQRLNASDVFEKIVEHAWATGEPGVVFIDRINENNPTRLSETIEATNPCGEQPLPPFDSCNLGSVNLGLFALDPLPDDYTINEPSAGIDWEALGHMVRLGVHFLDNVIDQNKYPIPAIEVQTRLNRRIGLGVMGWADLLVKLRLPYNSDQAFELADRVMHFIYDEAVKHSSHLATQRGKLPNWNGTVYREQGVAMRNATVTTIAPTGTISIIAGCSSGIEPYYAVAYERNVLDGTRMIEINPLFERALADASLDREELAQRLLSSRSLAEMSDIPEALRAVYLTAADINSLDHIRMQAAFQKHCDSSVSKTINFPQSASRDDVATAFREAFRLGCKGVTVYRDESRPNQVLSVRKAASAATGEDQPGPEWSDWRVVDLRPGVLSGITQKIRTGYGNLYVTVNTRNGLPFEVFAHIGKSGYTTMADTEAICRLISLALRSHVPIEQVIRQLKGIGGSSPVFSEGSRVSSIPDAIAQVLEQHFGHIVNPTSTALPPEMCPDCGSAMTLDSGCYLCAACGYSSC